MKQELVQRLRQEKEDGLASAYKGGCALGKEQASQLHYKDLQRCGEGRIPPELWIDVKGIMEERAFTGSLERRFTRDEIQEFKRGYLEGVQEFWQEIKGQL